ncbi:glycosyltransferase [Rhizobium mesoamericanum]|uniref:Glycosyltransferase protein n=1 Tax=Rhizobium mesoamericanum STM3625 TaxID=1211777 RepID=K0PNI5_9HYPH|nr:glycosyltransferase [Rhizobium mesoamericanum]CCM78081.1 Glycosyltransferase protein [Rhizobium mesoamericanum STM3625]
MNAVFTINGRFLGQRTTGVQRYALNVVKALDAALIGTEMRASIAAPIAAVDPNLQHIALKTSGVLRGHAWEQLRLPSMCEGRLLNLCNTAPAVKNDQIVCIHDANIFAAPDSYGRFFRLAYQVLQPRLVRHSVRIATVSYAAARQIARHLPICAKDIAVLPNGHEHALSWNPDQAKIAARLFAEQLKSSDRQFVLAIGSRARHKNLAMLVSAAERLDELGIDLVFAGGGAEIFTHGTLDRKRNIYRLDHVSDDDLAYLLDRALCLAFPSLTEGFGLPIIEAMARGCAVVAADCASMPEVCGQAALLASPFDSRGWIRHIQALNGSPQLKNDLVERGRERARMFSWSNTAAGYLELLDRPAVLPRIYKPYFAAVPHVCVAYATRGRPNIVSRTVRHLLATQTVAPGAIIVSCVDKGDAGDLVSHPGVTVLIGPPGLAAQRNTALAHLPPDTEIVVFFDDDFVADKNWLAAAIETFRDESQVVGFTGTVVADGIKGPGILFEDALHMLDTAPHSERLWSEPYSPYGCNMAFRVCAIGEVRFDERLVLYGWLEDRDFAAALARRGGRLVKSSEASGVHLGVKSGRVSGERLGYSQVVNPLYMLRKGTMTMPKVAGQVLRNMASNFGRAAWPEPFIDRRGRARGNLMGLADVFRGRLEPERAASLPARNEERQAAPRYKRDHV